MEELMYSIDKVKLVATGYKVSYLQMLGDSLLTMSKLSRTVVEQYQSSKISKCHKSFIVEGIEGNIYIGFNPNWIRCASERERAICVEFNPNKVHLEDFDIFHGLFNDVNVRIKILSIDVAIDMLGVDINDIIVHKWHGNVKEIEYKSSRRETVYLGDLGHNHIKIYDKAREQKLDNVKWTRFEITLKDLGYYCKMNSLDFELPTLSIISKQLRFEDLEMSNKERYYLMNYIYYPEGINYLDSRTKKKVLELAATNLKTICIDKSKIINVIREYRIA